jgi:hypothetical protein
MQPRIRLITRVLLKTESINQPQIHMFGVSIYDGIRLLFDYSYQLQS